MGVDKHEDEQADREPARHGERSSHPETDLCNGMLAPGEPAPRRCLVMPTGRTSARRTSGAHWSYQPGRSWTGSGPLSVTQTMLCPTQDDGNPGPIDGPSSAAHLGSDGTPTGPADP